MEDEILAGIASHPADHQAYQQHMSPRIEYPESEQIVARQGPSAIGGVTAVAAGPGTKRLVYEWHSLKVKSLPKAGYVEEWMAELICMIDAASGRMDSGVVVWLKEVEQSFATMEFLRESGKEFATLDKKLSTALSDACDDQRLRRKFAVAANEELERHLHVINGRQKLFIILRALRTNPTLKNYYGVEHLQSIKLLGEECLDVEKFLSDWIKVTTGMKSSLSDEELAALLYARIRNSAILSRVATKFRDAGHENPHEGKHTHEWLLESMQNLVDDHEQDINNAKRLEAHTQKTGKKQGGINANAAETGGGKGTGREANVTKAAAAAAAKAVSSAMAPYLQNLAAGSTAPAIKGPPPKKGAAVDSDSWIQSLSACAAELTTETEYKPMPDNLKGGRICMDMLLHQKCDAGDRCPAHHVSGHVCLAYQTKTGCKNRSCKFKHELLGPTYAKALGNMCKQKAATNKAKSGAAAPKTKPGAKPKAEPKTKAAAPKHPGRSAVAASVGLQIFAMICYQHVG